MKDTDRQFRGEEYDSAFDYSEEEDKPERLEEQPEEEPGKKRGGMKLLTSIQVFGSLAILAAALVLRLLGGEMYQKVRAWYLSAVDDSIIADEQMDQVKQTVVDLWNNLSTAGLKAASGESQASGAQSQTESRQQAAGSGNASGSVSKTVS